MGIITKIALATAVVLAVLGIGAGIAGAAASNPIVQGTTNKSVYKVGTNVTITGTVNGDVFCAGQTITVDATVNGDVLCAGQNVTVNGTVNGNVRLAGQSITLGATVKKAASVAGQNVTVENSANVANDLSLLAQTATVDGKVGRDVSGAVQNLMLNSSVGRNVTATVSKLDLRSNALIHGDLTYTASNRNVLQRASGAQVLGSQTFHQAAQHENRHMNWAGIHWAWTIYGEVALIILSLILVAFFPQRFAKWNQIARSRFWVALLTGFIAMFVVPAIIIALFASLVGALAGLFLLVAWLLAAILSAPIAAYFVGGLILRREKRIPLVMLLGAVILALICLVPVLGFVVTVFAYWLGIGTLLISLRRGYGKPNYIAA